MESSVKLELQKVANRIRRHVIEGTFCAKCGHPGGSLSAADMLAYLYFKEMRIDPKNPKWEDRDRFVLSKGHAAPALYGALALRGFFAEDEIKNLRQIGSMLQGHPSMRLIPGVDMSTGSLGQGFSTAAGMALSAKLNKKDYRVYAILGDGEIQEGQVWETAMFAPNKGLSNLTAIIDNNNLQIDGTVEEVNSPYPIAEKFAAFGWDTVEIDGHDFDQIEMAIEKAKASDKPMAVIMKTVKGKGVSYMEDVCGWHGKAPNADEYKTAVEELDAAYAELCK
ncbi:MAG: transketolase [Clostridia bacterium]|nr:transketolase [Clostridia bacterium]